jgi:hypothetical protein
MSAYRQAYEEPPEIDEKALTKEFHEMYDFWLRCHGKTDDGLSTCLAFMEGVWWPMGKKWP